MPSPRDPSTVVLPGGGKDLAGTVTASNLAFPVGTGDDLANHLEDPLDAHMSGAIGIPSTDPVTGLALSSILPGGHYDGESLLDALRLLQGTIPVCPNRIGFNTGGIPNSGIPQWGTLTYVADGGLAVKGAFTAAGVLVPSQAIVPTGSSPSILTGIVYPADRGVLALYYCTTGAFTVGTTSLVSAVWLGSATPPAGISTAGFSESLREAGQANYTASGAGIDNFSLTDRRPYGTSMGAPYTSYATNFPAYQLGSYTTVVPVVIPNDSSGSFLFVHWRASFAVSLSAISTWSTANLVAANCHSAVPVVGATIPTGESVFDQPNMQTVTRRNVFVDTLSASPPAGSVTTSAHAGTTFKLSGVNFYASDFTFTLQVDATDLFNKGYLTGSVASPPDVLANFTSAKDPVQINFADFGVPTLVGKAYTLLQDGGSAAFNSTSNVPLTTDTARLGPTANTAIPSLPALTYGAPSADFARVRANLNRGVSSIGISGTVKYLYNGYPQTGGSTVSTETLEKFFDERFRVDTLHQPVIGDPLPPTGGGVKYDSTVALTNYNGATVPGSSLQVIGGRLVYPQRDFSTCIPAGTNCNTIFLNDAINSGRGYVRAFNTGRPRATGRFRIKGIVPTTFAAEGALQANYADHPGKVVILLQVPDTAFPGLTGYLDLGRAKGSITTNPATDLNGCLIAQNDLGASGWVYSYDLTVPTKANGSGKYLVYMTIFYVKDSVATTPVGSNIVENLAIQEIEWLAPL